MTGSYALFGPVVDAGQVQQAIQDTTLTWIDTYLVAVERANSLPDRYYDRPRSWRIDDSVRRLPEDQMPVLLVVSGGDIDEPSDTRGDGLLDEIHDVGITVIGKAGKRHDTALLARRYMAALKLLLNHKGGDFGGVCRLASKPAGRTDEVIRSEGGTNREYLGVAYVTFRVLVTGAMSRAGGPDTPAPGAPATVPSYPAGPAVQTVGVTVNHL
jgi:hypothetical protein